MRCKIQWITSAGKLTPDDNEAVAIAYVEAHTANYGVNPKIDESDHFPICAEHLARLGDPKDGTWEHWKVIPLKA